MSPFPFLLAGVLCSTCSTEFETTVSEVKLAEDMGPQCEATVQETAVHLSQADQRCMKDEGGTSVIQIVGRPRADTSPKLWHLTVGKEGRCSFYLVVEQDEDAQTCEVVTIE